jgi:cation diffusion facilitator CzcD-associated flavoprotein CzcO
MYTLGYRFRPWTDPQAIADGPSILRYVRATADEAGIVPKIRFGHVVRRAEWSSAAACWTVHGERAADGAAVRWRARFLFVCSGYYRYDEGYRPAFEGEGDFAGRIVNPQFWPEELDVSGRKVVVIGSGATAVTLVPALAETAAHVTMLQRSPTYVVTRPARDPIAQFLQRVLPERLAYALARWKNVLIGTFYYRLARRKPAEVKERIVAMAAQQVGPDCDAHTHFSPRYNPWDQRLCLVPDGDLFEAISAGDADVVTDTINTFTETGVKLDSGEELEADVIITATGLEMLFLGGVRFEIDGEEVDPPSSMTYKGMMLSEFPNMAFSVGYSNASWTLKVDLTCEYVCRLLNHMDAHGYAQCVPRANGTTPSEEPLVTLTSGYVMRALDRLPKQGPKDPWQLRQNYAIDLRHLRHGPLTDSAMEFSAPSRDQRPTEPAEPAVA